MLQPRWQNIAFILLGVMTLSYFLHNVYGRDLFHIHIGRGCRRIGILTGIFIILGVCTGLWSLTLWRRARREKRWTPTIGIVRSVRTTTTVRLLLEALLYGTVCPRFHCLSHCA